MIKHGKTKTRIYRTWFGMKKRCFRKSYEHYDCYGGRGIKVCDEWLGENGFSNFYKWAMENGYNDTLEIDRIDVNGDYTPENCRWVTRTLQVRNRRTTVFIEYNGERKTLQEWCEIYGINYKLAWGRFNKGWEIDKVLNTSSYLKRGVDQFDLDGNFIKHWDCINDAIRELNARHISAVCRNQRKQCKGYLWKYSDTYHDLYLEEVEDERD